MDLYLKTLPIIVLLVLGYLLKRSKLMSSEDGTSLLKYIFYVGAPAIVFKSLSSAELNLNFFAFALVPISTIFIVLLTAYILKDKFKKIDAKTLGSLTVGAAIINTGFMIPVISSLFGNYGLARLAVADGFNALIVFSVVYAFACNAGNKNPSKSFILNKILRSPVIYTTLLALVFNSLNLKLPSMPAEIISSLAATVSPIILISIGLKINLKFNDFKLVNLTILIRAVIGMAVSMLIYKIFRLNLDDFTILSLIALAPVGFNSITFAELENLNVDIAASQVFLSLMYYLVITLPFVMFVSNKLK